MVICWLENKVVHNLNEAAIDCMSVVNPTREELGVENAEQLGKLSSGFTGPRVVSQISGRTATGSFTEAAVQATTTRYYCASQKRGNIDIQ